MYSCHIVLLIVVIILSNIVALNDSDDDLTHTNRPHLPITEIPHYYFLHLLLSNSSSLWKHSSQDTDEITSWSRCNEYFEFLVNLLKELLGTLLGVPHPPTTCIHV